MNTWIRIVNFIMGVSLAIISIPAFIQGHFIEGLLLLILSELLYIENKLIAHT